MAVAVMRRVERAAQQADAQASASLGRSRRRLDGDVGAMTTEAVIIIAGLAALALAVVAIIVAKVTAKANAIPTE